MPPKYSTSFQVRWKNEFSWIKEEQKGMAWCLLCKKEINYQSMGRTALVSHEKSSKHKEIVQNCNKSIKLPTFFSHQPDTVSSPIEVVPATRNSPEPSTSQTASTSKNVCRTLDSFRIRDSVTEAETLWCLHTVMAHHSLRSSESAVHLFKRMFSTCETAQEMRLGKDKISYSIIYGLGPFFKKQLLDLVNSSSSDYFVVAFDESLNKVSQTQQMDLCVRYWDDKVDRVATRYLTSVFLYSSKAEDLLKALIEGLNGLRLDKILQISMDGPNVNKKMLRLLKQEMRPNEDDRKLLEIGSCGLHTVNVAFKTGIEKTGWELLAFFRSIYYVFKDSPARRGEYFALTQTKMLPKKFCAVRWVENVDVSKRAQDILPHLKKYVEKVKGTNREPSSKSFKIMSHTLLTDTLLPAKISFFQWLAEEVEPFLKDFQTDAPMVPFLHEDLCQMLKGLMEKFVKSEVLNDKPIKEINVMEKGDDGSFVNLKVAKNIDLSYGVRAAIAKCKGFKDKEILKFRQDCRTCLLHMTCKLLEKSPLKYSLTESISFLNPNNVGLCQKTAIKNMKNTFDVVLESNLAPPSVIEKADREFKALLDKEIVVDKMKQFSRSEERIDDFWIGIFKENPSTHNLEKLTKLLLSLSHGNAAVERGFSINRDLVVENLRNESLIAQRLIYDSVKSTGGLEAIKVSKELILSMRNSNSRWKQALEEKKTRQSREEKETAEKRKAHSLAKELEEKKRKIMDETKKTVTALEEEIKNLRKKV